MAVLFILAAIILLGLVLPKKNPTNSLLAAIFAIFYLPVAVILELAKRHK